MNYVIKNMDKDLDEVYSTPSSTDLEDVRSKILILKQKITEKETTLSNLLELYVSLADEKNKVQLRHDIKDIKKNAISLKGELERLEIKQDLIIKQIISDSNNIIENQKNKLEFLEIEIKRLIEKEKRLTDYVEKAKIDKKELEDNFKEELQKQLQVNLKNRKIHKSHFIESIIWFILSLILTLFISDFFNTDKKINSSDFYYNFIISISVLFVPIIFNLIFGKLPFGYLHQWYENRHNIKEDQDSLWQSTDYYDFNIYTTKILLESTKNAERLYNLSKVYLLVGCLVSFLGVVIFFTLINTPLGNVSISYVENYWVSKLLEYLPRFGILFFIEYIAFFFLKQYRVLMEEYRYYESIKRDRQNLTLLCSFLEKHENSTDVVKQFVDYLNTHTVVIPKYTFSDKLNTEKAVNKDLDFVSKMTEFSRTILDKNDIVHKKTQNVD